MACATVCRTGRCSDLLNTALKRRAQVPPVGRPAGPLYASPELTIRMLMHEFHAGGGCGTRYRTGCQNVLPPDGEAPILGAWGNAGSLLDGLPSKLCATPDLSGGLRMDALPLPVVSAELYTQPK